MSEYRRLGPGVYEEAADQSLHIDLVELCEALDVEPTIENQNIAERAVLDVFGGDVPIWRYNDGGGVWREAVEYCTCDFDESYTGGLGDVCGKPRRRC